MKADEWITWANFTSLMESKNPFIEPVSSEPLSHLYFDPVRPAIGARIESKGAPPVAFLAEVDIRSVTIGKTTYVEVECCESSLWRDFFDLACSMVRRVLDQGMTPQDAISGALSSWRELVARPRALSAEQELGLHGELIVLEKLALQTDWETALDSWFGPKAEEHDFKLSSCDIEVKTTVGEGRVHYIGSLEQLTCTPGKGLRLISVQLTGSNGDGAASLSETVIHIQSHLSGTSQLENTFESLLASANYKHSDSALYSTRRELRSNLRIIEVDDEFPLLTRNAIESILDERAQRVVQVNYRVNVEGLGVDLGDEEWTEMLTEGNK